MAHKHSVYDSDTHFSINAITRAIKNESSNKTALVQHDHNSERFTFELQRLIEGHDMSQCDKIEIHYINIGTNESEKSADVYLVDDMQISPDSENVVIFSWLISGTATKYAGNLNFLIRFTCLNGETIEYAWNTAIFKDITVDNGMDNGEAVIAEYSDVLEAWKEEVLHGADGAVTEIEEAKAEALNDIAEAKETMLSEIDLAAEIVQTTGESETAVMSQKAVTDCLAGKGKGNLFDNAFDEVGYINPTDGIDASAEWAKRTSEFYPFEKGTLYFVASKPCNSMVFLFYDENKQYIGYQSFNDEVIGQYAICKNGYFRAYTDGLFDGQVYMSNAVPSEPINYDYLPNDVPTRTKKLTVVNFGDSIFGNTQNYTSVSAQIAKKSGFAVFNGGFGGCHMSTHAVGWDRCSMYRLAEYIANKDFSSLVSATESGWSGMPNYFDETAKTLASVDFDGVDVITISYGTNDYREGNIPLDREGVSNVVNLFDGVFDESGFINPSTGVDTDAADYKRTSKFYPVPVGTNVVYVKLTEATQTYCLVCYNENKELIGYNAPPDNVDGATLTLPSGTAYFRAYTDKAFMGGSYITTEDVGIPPQYDYTTVCGALRYAIKRILSRYPHIKILVTTPIFRTFFDNEDNYSVAEYSDTKDWGSGTLAQYADRIKNACADMKVPCLDLYNESGLNEVTRLHYFPIDDGTHPNEKGRELMATLINGKLQTIC